ncbi:SDR family NAD(P)-dependent oxidoreductase [Streptomyces sp. NPDC059002]|uniref:SDR family NAD(P)-dependent oxidoreductase n=1 Tax=Streptomyces sp. NPDC059002 TaxID=3346690 RepID=UPI0036D132F1
MHDLHDRVAVITGAASGIGRGMAEAFADAGLRMVLSDIEEDALRTTTAGLRDGGADVHAVLADVSRADDISSLAEATLTRFGAVHVLCNNAGVHTSSTPSWESTLDDWAWLLGVNLMGVVHGIRAFLPVMIEQDEEAHIVNTASIGGLLTGRSLYGTTKAAVVSLSEAVQIELVDGGFKPRVSVLCPGLVDTDIFRSARNRPTRFPEVGPQPNGGSSVADIGEAFQQNGLNPRAVGDTVVQAICEERFYVLTHSGYAAHIQHRTAQILNGENPTLLPSRGQ